MKTFLAILATLFCLFCTVKVIILALPVLWLFGKLAIYTVLAVVSGLYAYSEFGK